MLADQGEPQKVRFAHIRSNDFVNQFCHISHISHLIYHYFVDANEAISDNRL